MDRQLNDILEAMLTNLDVLNDEMQRLMRSEQFKPNKNTLQLIEHIRGSCTCSLQNTYTLERLLQRTRPNVPVADILCAQA